MLRMVGHSDLRDRLYGTEEGRQLIAEIMERKERLPRILIEVVFPSAHQRGTVTAYGDRGMAAVKIVTRPRSDDDAQDETIRQIVRADLKRVWQETYDAKQLAAGVVEPCSVREWGEREAQTMEFERFLAVLDRHQKAGA